MGPVQFVLAEGVGRTYHDCTSAPGEVPERSKRKDIAREVCSWGHKLQVKDPHAQLKREIGWGWGTLDNNENMLRASLSNEFKLNKSLLEIN